ncbi:MAG: diaminopimelate decarboxylase [Hyphomicrobiales bacterium]|nr:diaminopimelate decarboxylase [Hyphomicrobiales bacterium]MCP5371046.1 diaminopimelate decarboxylase [Hyphomicrobiales bacterium]
MDHFTYRDGALHAEDVPLADIAAAVGTPVYVYSRATLARHYRVFADAFAGLDATICYAVKANSNLAVIRTLGLLGAGADVVSGGELQRALAAGIPAERVVFSGVGKTRDELAQALAAGVMEINVESDPELEVLSQVAAAMGVEARVAVRINPDVDARTHAKITTGRSENKFGIEWTRTREVYARIAELPGLRAEGVAVHIGSQLTDMEPYRDAYTRMRDLVAMLRADGHDIRRLDLGGGLGIPYVDAGNTAQTTPGPADYAAVVREVLGDLDCRLVLEPGRVIAGNAGVLLTRVIYVKEGATRTFVIVDAAMNDLMRPSLYDAYHKISPVREPLPGEGLIEADVVGPICESGDSFGKARPLPACQPDDLLVLRSAGAYGAVMASAYNARPLVPEVLVDGDRFAVVRERVTIQDMMDRESMPDWLDAAAPAEGKVA